MPAAYGIEGYCRDLTRLIDETTPAARCVEVARERSETLLKLGLALADDFRVVVPGQYSRNLVYRDPRGLFVILAMIWKPNLPSLYTDPFSKVADSTAPTFSDLGSLPFGFFYQVYGADRCTGLSVGP